jgi:hypothetical protein
MCENCNRISTSDRFAMFVGKTVIWGSVVWFAAGVVRPLVKHTHVNITFGSKKEAHDA